MIAVGDLFQERPWSVSIAMHNRPAIPCIMTLVAATDLVEKSWELSDWALVARIVSTDVCG